jgi:hypothetical protein
MYDVDARMLIDEHVKSSSAKSDRSLFDDNAELRRVSPSGDSSSYIGMEFALWTVARRLLARVIVS